MATEKKKGEWTTHRPMGTNDLGLGETTKSGTTHHLGVGETTKSGTTHHLGVGETIETHLTHTRQPLNNHSNKHSSKHHSIANKQSTNT